ncbi:hypothetical protein T4A_9803 [Trichinella pseudospiralis]|uniref:Uncharacterized protein n=1 Tax=Trichinella pseudospiralis TaxID=6337 RepID=A0A0V1ETY9_TRIPS|nr:hypothetical protein T4A_9803 [Trichinella pseudospiralis]
MDVRRCSFLPIASDKVRAQSSSPTHADTIHPNCQLTNTLQFRIKILHFVKRLHNGNFFIHRIVVNNNDNVLSDTANKDWLVSWWFEMLAPKHTPLSIEPLLTSRAREGCLPTSLHGFPRDH